MNKSGRIYLDYNATAPLRPEILPLMQEILAQPGNASSVHGFGRAARARIEKARDQVAQLAGTQGTQVIFTSGATEANNMVLRAFAGRRILVSAIEHPSVLEAAPDAIRIPVTGDGVIDMDAFERLLENGPPPDLVSVMMVNNETGAIQPVGKIAKIAKKKFPSLHVHCDAVQAAGKIEINFQALHLDYMSLSSHKIAGPQGAGALITAPGAQPVKLLHGGGQEKRQRAGTENVAAIAGFGLAVELALKHLSEFEKLTALRDRLEDALQRTAPGLVILAKNTARAANTSAFALPGIPAQTQVMALDLDGIAVSSGSACSSGTIKASHVAQAMDLHEAVTAGLIRVSMGWNTTTEDIDSFAASWEKMAQRLKEKTDA